jgi:hypothetical protein
VLGSVTIRTRFTPPITLAPGVGTGGGQGGGGGLLAAIMLPEVESGPLVYAPAGRPGDQWVLWSALAALGLVAIVMRIVRK